VRTGTLRLIAAEGGDRRRFAVPACCRISRNARSILAALIVSNLLRTSGTSCKWSCCSIASTKIRSSGRSRLPQIRSDAPRPRSTPRAPPHRKPDGRAAGHNSG
jgi:hypothetical protein